MGQSPEQERIIKVLESSLEVLAAQRKWQSVLVGADHFFAWVEGETNVQVSPDIFLLDDPPWPPLAAQERLPRRWETWRPGHNPPRFAVEIVSKDWKKDYEINPARYDHLGVSELVIADADAWYKDLESRGRYPLVVYRRVQNEARQEQSSDSRVGDDDRLELVYRGREPAYCAEIDAYLGFRQGLPGVPEVRVSTDPQGRDIVPTAQEKARAAEDRARTAEGRARTAEGRARTAEDRARAAEKLSADQAAEIAALRAQLYKLQG